MSKSACRSEADLKGESAVKSFILCAALALALAGMSACTKVHAQEQQKPAQISGCPGEGCLVNGTFIPVGEPFDVPPTSWDGPKTNGQVISEKSQGDVG